MPAPQTPGELAAALGEAAAHGRTISLAGHDSKRLMAGPTAAADCAITTAALKRGIEYEPPCCGTSWFPAARGLLISRTCQPRRLPANWPRRSAKPPRTGEPFP